MYSTTGKSGLNKYSATKSKNSERNFYVLKYKVILFQVKYRYQKLLYLC